MKMIRIALNGLALVLADIAGVGLGALAAYRIIGVTNQVWLQLPIAVVLTVGFFWLWLLALRGSKLARLESAGSKEVVACLAASILWAPLIFVPLHYVSQGYVTSIGNLVALALYQLPVNAIAFLVASILPAGRPPAASQQTQ